VAGLAAPLGRHQRAVAVLAGLVASAKNLLVLDEPTNHLDIPSAERLEDALALEIPATSESEGRPGGAYDGTLILISHDPAALRMYCDRGYILENGQLTPYDTVEEMIEAYYAL